MKKTVCTHSCDWKGCDVKEMLAEEHTEPKTITSVELSFRPILTDGAGEARVDLCSIHLKMAREKFSAFVIGTFQG